MIARIVPGDPRPVRVDAPPSKSLLHRMLCAAALCGTPCEFALSGSLCGDVKATAQGLSSMGASVAPVPGGLRLTPGAPAGSPTVDCGDSATTLHLLLSVAAGLGIPARFCLSPRLAARPHGPLIAALRAGGASIAEEGSDLLLTRGLSRRELTVDSALSSQYASGLLFALAAMGGGELTVERLSSAPYLDMTCAVLERFGLSLGRSGSVIRLSGALSSPGRLTVEGDWSCGACPLAAGLPVAGLDADSLQGDRCIADYLRAMGGTLTAREGGLTLSGELSALEADLGDAPDLLPPLCAAAVTARGTSVFSGVGRLRQKESDRLAALCEVFSALGGDLSAEGDRLTVRGVPHLHGGEISPAGDHRIAMAAAADALREGISLTVCDAECVCKSWPEFFSAINVKTF